MQIDSKSSAAKSDEVFSTQNSQFDALTNKLTQMGIGEKQSRITEYINQASSEDKQDLAIQRLKHLYGTSESQGQRLYGGRMNEARRMEVKVVTHEAIETLHNALIQRPPDNEEVDDPAGLKLSLMPHQRRAIKWLQWRETQNPSGGILADDMGLGKTLTMIGLVLSSRVNCQTGKTAIHVNALEQAKRRLNTIINGVLLRRTKEQLCSVTGKPIIDLPSKKATTHHIRLSDLERKVYDRLFLASKKQVADYIRQQDDKDSELVAVSQNLATQKDFGYKNPFNPRKNTASGSAAKEADFYTRSHILVLLLRLRQACSHLALMREAIDLSAFDDFGDSESVTDDLINQFNDLSLLHTEQVGADIEASVEELFDRGFASTKVKVILEHIKCVIDSTSKMGLEKMVVVSQWTKLLEIVGEHLASRSISYTTITGAVKIEERSERVQMFNQRGAGPAVLLLSLTAGGVGLNLTGGNHLFLVDLHWNPAVEQQACDRIYRMGQTKDVIVHKFICSNTIEEKVFALQQRKVALAQSVLSGAGERSLTALSFKDIKYLFEL